MFPIGQINFGQEYEIGYMQCICIFFHRKTTNRVQQATRKSTAQTKFQCDKPLSLPNTWSSDLVLPHCGAVRQRLLSQIVCYDVTSCGREDGYFKPLTYLNNSAIVAMDRARAANHPRSTIFFLSDTCLVRGYVVRINNTWSE